MRDPRSYDWYYGEIVGEIFATRSSARPSVRRSEPWWRRDTTRLEISVIAFIIVYLLAHLVWWAVRGMP